MKHGTNKNETHVINLKLNEFQIEGNELETEGKELETEDH